MENKNIISVGNFFFWFSFILGNICLFGYLITRIEFFVSCGFMLLLIATPVNLLVVLCLIIYGLVNKPQLQACINASLIIGRNIPISILYFFLGMFLMEL